MNYPKKRGSFEPPSPEDGHVSIILFFYNRTSFDSTPGPGHRSSRASFIRCRIYHVCMCMCVIYGLNIEYIVSYNNAVRILHNLLMKCSAIFIFVPAAVDSCNSYYKMYLSFNEPVVYFH